MKPKKDNPKMKTGTQDGKIVAAPGYKMAITPKKGESATKQMNVGSASTMVNNGIYAPKPTAASKAPAPAKKSNFKTPSSKQTGMKMAMKKGGKGRKC